MVFVESKCHLTGVDYICKLQKYMRSLFFLSRQIFAPEKELSRVFICLFTYLFCSMRCFSLSITLKFQVQSGRKAQWRKHNALIKSRSDFPEGRLSSSINLVYHIIKRLPCPSLPRQLVLISQQVFHC